MVIRYCIGQVQGETIFTEERCVEINSAPDFFTWLRGQGCGEERARPEVTSSWAELYRELITGRGLGYRISRTRAEGVSFISFDGIAPSQS